MDTIVAVRADGLLSEQDIDVLTRASKVAASLRNGDASWLAAALNGVIRGDSGGFGPRQPTHSELAAMCDRVAAKIRNEADALPDGVDHAEAMSRTWRTGYGEHDPLTDAQGDLNFAADRLTCAARVLRSPTLLP